MPVHRTHWKAVRRALNLTRTLAISIAVLTAVIFPVTESIFVNLLTAATSGSKEATALGTALIVIAIVHAALAVLLVLQQAAADPAAVADAIELESAVDQQKDEIHRRNSSYKVLCSTLSSLNQETCHLDSDEPHLCTSPFAERLRTILTPVLNSPGTVFGIAGTEFTIELYLHNWQLAIGGLEKGVSGYALEFFYSPTIPIASPLALKECSPVLSAFHANIANEQEILQNRHLFYAPDGKRKPQVYFERYAVCPVSQACSPSTVGLLMLTSEQKTPFASDVRDSLALVASLISRYLSDYRGCIAQQYGSYDRSDVLIARLYQAVPLPAKIQADGTSVTLDKTGLIVSSPDGKQHSIGLERLPDFASTVEGEHLLDALQRKTPAPSFEYDAMIAAAYAQGQTCVTRLPQQPPVNT